MGRGRARDLGRALIAALGLVCCRASPADEVARTTDVVAVTPPNGDAWVLDGCTAMIARTRCVVADDARLRLWSPLSDGAWTFVGDAGVIVADEVATDDGRRYTFALPHGTTRVLARTDEVEIDIAIERDPPPGIPEAVTPGSTAAGRDATPAELSPAGDGLARLRGGIARRRRAFADERWAAAVAAADETFALASALGRWTEACEASFAAAHVLAEYLDESERASERLDRVTTCLAIDRAQATRVHYHRGRIASLRGDERTAIDHFREAARAAERLGRTDDELAATAAHAEVARGLGDVAALDRLVERTAELALDDADGCGAAMAMSSVAWAQLMVAEHQPSTRDARPVLRRALATLSGDACRRPSVIAHVQLDLALAELQAGDVGQAEAMLTAVVPDDLDLGATQWFHDLRIRAALAAGRPASARDDLAALERWASAQDDDELRWRAALRRGELELASGRVDDGIAALHVAEDALDRAILEVALDLGRPEYASQHGRSAGLLASILVGRGRLDAALCVVRRARTRGVRPLILATRAGVDDPAVVAARARWHAARERIDRAELDGRDLPRALLAEHGAEIARARAELRTATLGPATDPADGGAACPALARSPGRLTLIYARGAHGWLAFADDADGLVVEELEAIDPADRRDHLARIMLEPFADGIDRADEIVVIAEGDALAVPIHALPWRGAPLVSTHALAWSSDLGARTRAATGTTAAVVFADARDDLGHLRGHAALLARHMGELGWSIVGDATARTRGTAVREALAQVRLFHYFGHVGVPGSELGRETPWSNMLLLDEGTLGIDDVLALPRVPEAVVLLGCGTALGGAMPRGTGEGLAQAFLLAGAGQAIASVGDLDAELAAGLGTELYQGAAPQFDAALALARAQRRWLARGEGEAIWVLRAWIR